MTTVSEITNGSMELHGFILVK